MAAKIVEDTAGLVSIGELAKAAGVSSRTIRYYEELGILPEPRRSPGGTRKYPREYRGYIDTALALKDLGFRLEEIKPLARLALGRSVSAGQRDVAARLVDERIESLGRQVAILRRLRACVQAPDAATGVPGVLSTVSEPRGAAPPGLTSQGEPEGLKGAPQASGNTERARGKGGASEGGMGRRVAPRGERESSAELAAVPPLRNDGAA